MRQLTKRPKLSATTSKRLSDETAKIKAAVKPKDEAANRYKAARGAAWFKPVLAALREMTGAGERCMFCSGSESSNLEHYQPKAVFPELAMTWENYLWSCVICNAAKSDNFPLANDQRLLNPSEEKVWDFFFIDELGFLTAKFNATLNAQEPRAVSTMGIIKLNRQALQETRQKRLKALQRNVRDSIQLFKTGNLTKKDLRDRIIEWCEEPAQLDIADYFLNGPGKVKEPFAELFKLLK